MDETHDIAVNFASLSKMLIKIAIGNGPVEFALKALKLAWSMLGAHRSMIEDSEQARLPTAAEDARLAFPDHGHQTFLAQRIESGLNRSMFCMLYT